MSNNWGAHQSDASTPDSFESYKGSSEHQHKYSDHKNVDGQTTPPTIRPHSYRNYGYNTSFRFSVKNARVLREDSTSDNGSNTSVSQSLFMDNGNNGWGRIDFVLVNNLNDDSSLFIKAYREDFENKLRREGLVLEECISDDMEVRFLKIHAPWKVLTRFAQILKLDMPIAVMDEIETEKDSIWKKICNKFHYDKSVLPDIPQYHTAWYTCEKEHKFLIGKKSNFFSPAQRSSIIYYILENTLVERGDDVLFKGRWCQKYKDTEYLGDTDTKVFVGIKSLLDSKIYTCAYPLHEGDYHQGAGGDRGDNLRHSLYTAWAHFSTARYRLQPLEHIKIYFGEMVAFYFAWLGFYSIMLIPAAVVGVALFTYGALHHGKIEIREDVCNKSGAGKTVMCPICHDCEVWELHDACLRSSIQEVFDHSLTVVFAFFMSLWTVVLEQLWIRQEAKLCLQWHVRNFKQEESQRAKYKTVKGRRVTTIKESKSIVRRSQVTRRLTYYGKLLSVTTIVIILITIVAFMACSIMVNIALKSYARNNVGTWGKQGGRLIAMVVSSVVNVAMILFLEVTYQPVAKLTTDFELHKTDSDWEDSYILKLFLFKFIINFIPLFYLAYFKGQFRGHPDKPNFILGFPLGDKCILGECFIDLSVQHMAIMFGKAAIKPIQMIWVRLRTRLKNLFRYGFKKDPSAESNKPQWEKDFLLTPIPDHAVINEYLEMMIQYADVTLFAVAFPLAPLIALVHSFKELRSDAIYFTELWRRPVAQRTQGIQIWLKILRGINYAAVLTNALLIAFTSIFVRREIYRYDTARLTNATQFVYFGLSDFNINELSPEYKDRNGTCKYFAFREAADPNVLTLNYWRVLAFKFVFVVSFVFVVVLCSWIIDYIIPDIPERVRLQSMREDLFLNRAILELQDDGFVNPITDSISDVVAHKSD